MSDTSASGVGAQGSGSTVESSSPTSTMPTQSPGGSVFADRSSSSCLSNGHETDKLPPWAKEYSDLPAWACLPTEEPLSPELRARVKERLIDECYFNEMDRYRHACRVDWTYGKEMEIKSTSVQLGFDRLTTVLNCLTLLYWMPSAAQDGRRSLPSNVTLGCILNEWFKYHNDEPYTEHWNFFANLVRILPSGPTTVQGILQLHKLLFDQAASLLPRVKQGEYSSQSNEGTWDRTLQNYHIRPTFRAIIIMLDQRQRTAPAPPLEPQFRGLRTVSGAARARRLLQAQSLFNIDEHAKKQTVLLMRTGDDLHLQSPIDFDVLKANGLCLPVDRTDVPNDNNDVVRVSLATAIKFICDLEQKEDTACPERPRALLEKERRANKKADAILKEADEKGMDNVQSTWLAVRRTKALQMGQSFRELKHESWTEFLAKTY